MSSVLKYWKEAATLLLVAKTRTPSVTKIQTTNYEVLMLKRSGKSKFMPKLHVFPGGMSHDSDFSAKWLDLYSLAGDNCVKDLDIFFKRGGPGSFMFSRTRPEEFSKVPSELAFRICAIRETFEESGILMVRDISNVKNGKLDSNAHPLSGKSSILSDTILMPWRKKVDNDAWEFIKMCEELKVVPDVWSLYEWTNWLTPIIPSANDSEKTRGRRYDTAFYVCVLDYIPNAVHDDKETTELEWSSASQFMLKHIDPESELQLAPPQITELGRLLNFTDAEKLKKFAYESSAVRADLIFPVSCFCDNGGVLFLYPGDNLYPEDPDVEGLNPPFTVPGTIEELRIKYPRMHRSEMFMENGTLMRTLKCNVPMPDGRAVPIYDILGDNLYPEDPDVEGLNPPFTVPGTIEELRIKYPRMHRSEMFMENGTLMRTLKCNVPMPDGRAVPIYDILGDNLYPEDPDVEGLNPPFTVPGTIEELRIKYPRMHRSEMFMENGTLMRTLKCNVPMPDGRAVPIYDILGQKAVQSKI